jgi:hypothetical protein
LALLWTNQNGDEILHRTDGWLLRGGQSDATWLPNGWEMDCFPAGWTLAHLERWFAHALHVASLDNRTNIQPGFDTSPAHVSTRRALVAHAHLIVRHLGLPSSPTEPRGPMDQAGCIAELRDVLSFLRRVLPPAVCEEHLPMFSDLPQCLAYLKQVTPTWPPMGIDWPYVLCLAERMWAGSVPHSQAVNEGPRTRQEIPEYLQGAFEAEFFRQADPFSRGYAYASLLLEAFLQLDAFCTASLVIGYDLDAIPRPCDKLPPYHALMGLGWLMAECIRVLRDTAKTDFEAIEFASATPIQVGTAFGKNAHDAVIKLASEICELSVSVTEGKSVSWSPAKPSPGETEYTWAMLCQALQGRLPNALDVKRIRVQLEIESRTAFDHSQLNSENSGEDLINRLQPVIPPKPIDKATPEDVPRYIFKQVAELWEVTFGQEHGKFKPIDGIVYIAHLLRHPGKAFSAGEMKKLTADANVPGRVLTEGSQEILAGQIGMTQGTRQEAVDQKTIRECKERLSEILSEREAVRQAGEIDKLDDLEEEEKRITDYLAKARNIRGNSRPLGDSQRSMFNSVKQAIDRVVKKLGTAQPPLPRLHEHLSRAIDSRNNTFEYRPAPPAPAWEF